MEASKQSITVPDFARLKKESTRIVMVTAYDATFANLMDQSGVDAILVGDSVGTVVQGHTNTIPVTLDEMIYHVTMVARAKPKALIVGDLPFGSYQVSSAQAIASATALIKAGASAVKLEGGVNVSEAVAAIARVDIPVMGHIGLTPQSYHRMGGHKVQGRSEGNEPGGRERLLDDAHAVEQAGAFALVIEGVPSALASEITSKVSIPTIGIGAGVGCDGQVLVMHDLLGLTKRDFTFAKKYANLHDQVIEAVSQYANEVRAGQWPDEAHSYK